MKDGLQAMSERSIFLAALDISDTAQQTANLDQACGSERCCGSISRN